MAVKFKVPKSPKRDIAISDTFMGVDLTNTGANIDGYRSPHAPNMVRNVPGKVRKRMGYYKEVLFGTDENVNFAWGTSAQEKEIHISSDDTSTWVKIYDLIQTISSDASYTLYLEFDYKSEADFNIMDATTIVTASEDWEHISTSVECLSTDTFSDVKIFSEEAQNIYIKNFALLKTRTESYEWSPAPKYFVERETNDPVYGCHFLKNGTDGYDGDRVVNVNRVLKADTAISKNISGGSIGNYDIYYLGEVLCNAQTIYIDFDYEVITSSSSVNIYLQFSGTKNGQHGLRVQLDKTSGTPVHVSTSGIPIGYANGIIQLCNGVFTGSATVKISNFSVCYEKDENYKWSPAPEDNNEKFYVKDMYNIHSKDYAAINSAEKDTTTITVGSDITEIIEFCNNDSHPESNYQYLSFDVTTSLLNSSANLGFMSLVVRDSDGEWSWHKTRESYDENYKKEHMDVFYCCDDGKYLKDFYIMIGVTGASSKAHIKISNITIKDFVIRDDFSVHSSWNLYHVGKDFYLRAADVGFFDRVYSDANEHISQSFQINDNSYIIDGKDIYEFSIKEGESVEVIGQDNAYIPTVTKAREYNGGGVSVEAFNLLQPGFIEQFIGVATQKTYQLSQNDLDDTPVKAWLLDSNGNWNPKEEDTDFSVDRSTGKVTFVTAPGVTPLEGEDSIRIQAYKTFEGYRQRITKCRFGTLYGVSGAADRIFVSGNPEHPNWDFYSQYKDATYFPDIGYSTLGSSQSAITGYAIVSNYLATFKDGFDQSQSVFVREGDMLVTDEENKTSEPVFKLINSLQGVGSISPYSFGYLQTEPVFLTKAGIYAITEQDITGEKYSQNRSFYLDGQLRKEPNLETAFATVHDNQYILALNGKLYVLDGLQATRTDKSEPYATRQYAGFLCTDIPALTMWEDDAVCFGTNDGKVCRFYTDVEALESYNDDGKPIYSCWETPDLDGKLFYKNKTFRYMAVRLMQAVKTSVKLYSRRFGLWTLNAETAWNLIKEQTTISNMLDFENLDFNLFSFSADLSERLVHTKLRVKKVDKARFRVENGELNEPFGLFDLALEYIESGNYKG